jgi:hypothetical protein
MYNIGKCTECGAENVKVVCFDDGSKLCEECLESLYQQCDVCKEYYDPEYVEFFAHKDGRFICEYCTENFAPDEFEEDEGQ